MANSKTFEDTWTESRIPYGALRSRREVAEFFWNAALEAVDIADACAIFREAVRHEPCKKRAIARHMVKQLHAVIAELEELEEAEADLQRQRNQLRTVQS